MCKKSVGSTQADGFFSVCLSIGQCIREGIPLIRGAGGRSMWNVFDKIDCAQYN